MSAIINPSAPGGTVDGSGAATRVAFWLDADTLTSDDRLTWDSVNNRLRIGDPADPSAAVPLQVEGGDIVVSSYGSDAGLALRRANGTPGSPSGILSGDLLGEVKFQGYEGGFNFGAGIEARAVDTWSGFTHGTRLDFRTVPSGSTASVIQLRLRDSGSLESLITTGAPFIANTTTLCPNVNADLLDGLHASSFQPVDADLTALAALSGTGIAVRTAADTWALRTLVAPAAGLTITNPDGVAGNPTFALANDLAALEALAGTGYARRTGADAWTLDATATPSTHNFLDSTVHFNTATGTPVKGDLIVGNSTPAWARFGVGANGTVLTADSAEAGGVKWATPTGGSSPVTQEDGVQVVATTSTFNFIEPDATLVTESPANTARVDVSKYTLKAGRTGTTNDTTLSTTVSGTLYGSVVSGESMNLQSTTHATRGFVNTPDRMKVFNRAWTADNTTVTMIHVPPVVTVPFLTTPTFYVLRSSVDLTFSSTFPTFFAHRTVLDDSIIRLDQAPGSTSDLVLFDSLSQILANAASVATVALKIFRDASSYTAVNVAAGTVPAMVSLTSTPAIYANGASGSITVTDLTGLDCNAVLNPNTVGGSVTVTTRRAVRMRDALFAGLGTNVITSNIGLDVEALLVGTNNLAVRAAAAIIAAYSIGKFIVQTGYYHHFVKSLILTSTRRATAQGTARIRGS